MEHDYFEWLISLVCNEHHVKRSLFNELFIKLHDTEFTWAILNDKNRISDGLDLRVRFVIDMGYESSVADDIEGPCSILEMMVALALHCEEQIMDDPKIGDRTSQWFWRMIESLGLNSMCGERYNPDTVETILTKFVNREYQRNGAGGLFTLPNCTEDLRDVEIWHQLCWWLDKYIGL